MPIKLGWNWDEICAYYITGIAGHGAATWQHALGPTRSWKAVKVALYATRFLRVRQMTGGVRPRLISRDVEIWNPFELQLSSRKAKHISIWTSLQAQWARGQLHLEMACHVQKHHGLLPIWGFGACTDGRTASENVDFNLEGDSSYCAGKMSHRGEIQPAFLWKERFCGVSAISLTMHRWDGPRSTLSISNPELPACSLLGLEGFGLHGTFSPTVALREGNNMWRNGKEHRLIWPLLSDLITYRTHRATFLIDTLTKHNSKNCSKSPWTWLSLAWKRRSTALSHSSSEQQLNRRNEIPASPGFIRGYPGL